MWEQSRRLLSTPTQKILNRFQPSRACFLRRSGKDGIDADIIFNCGKYYLYYKDEYEKTICIAVSNEITGPYTEAEPRRACNTDIHLEGNCMYPLPGGKEYIMIADKYVDGGYYMQKTGDMFAFRTGARRQIFIKCASPEARLRACDIRKKNTTRSKRFKTTR